MSAKPPYFIYLAVALTGLCSLVYQTIWQRYLSFAIGSDASASVLILTVFLTALSVGYWFSGLRSSHVVGLELKRYGQVECIIGAWAMLFPWMFTLSLPLLGAAGIPVTVIDWSLTTVLIGPPAVLMGVTLPYLTQGLSSGFRTASRTHARIYAINTLGAFAGVVLAGFYLLEHHGLAVTSYALGALNLLIGLLVIIWCRNNQVSLNTPVSEDVVKEAAVESDIHSVNKACVLVVAACSGFLLIALETYFIRLFAIVTEGSHHAYPTVVGAFVAAVGLGAWLAGRWLHLAHRLFAWVPWWMLGLWLLIYYSLAWWPYTDLQLKQWLFSHTDQHQWLLIARFFLTLLVIALPVLASSMLLPWAFHFSKHQSTALGKTTGDLYAVATMATVVGGLVGGFWLFKWFDFQQIFLFFLAVMALMGLVASLAVQPQSIRRVTLCCVCALLLGAWVGFKPPHDLEKRLALGFYFQTNDSDWQAVDGAETARQKLWAWFGHDSWLATAVQPEGRVDVFESSTTAQRMIAINGRSNSDTALADLQGNGLLGLFPYVLTESPKRVLIIGLGTGVTAGMLAHQPDVEQVDVSEINSAVLNQLSLFDDFTYQASQNPKIRLIHQDVVKLLHQTDQGYDMIISIPSNFWVAGVENLMTPEFYALIREHLNPGGAFVQWVPEYRFSEQGLTTLARAFTEQFEHSSLWRLTPNDLVYVYQKGIADPLQQYWIQQRSNLPMLRKTLREMNVYNVRSLLHSQLADHQQLLIMAAQGARHNLDRPQLANMALEALYANDPEYNSTAIIQQFTGQKKAPR
ncbi:hypothetical protein ACFODZ_03420 [Marinicella sediminis]|uniref:Spermidine synthase n=1 Tax=Marinicella sediminis TaxID=1792834 RepID=A0ABV7JD01_9GAMM|nr:hypothetical protein [Marinicella sediminis]